MMKPRYVIKAYLSPELFHRWVKLCKENSTTSSAALNQVVRKLVGIPSNARPLAGETVEEAPDRSRNRVQIRLTDSEMKKLAEAACQGEHSVTQYIVGLVRSHLTKDPQLGMAELTVLGESNRQLAAIGSNLNQIARRINSEGGAVQMESVVHLKRELDRHLALVRNVMLANRERWTIR